MTGGLAAYPAGTLVDRALAAILDGARSPQWLAINVLGLPNAPAVVAERLAMALLGADPRVQRRADGAWSVAVGGMGVPTLEECAFAVVDVETTGSRSSTTDRVTEVAVVLVQGERREVLFDSLVNPGRPISPMVTSVTGITNAMVRAAPPFEEVAERVMEALSGRVFVAHNARFDWAFLRAELRRARGLRLEGPLLCTVRLARRLLPGAESCSLDALSYFFSLENSARHRAGGDARTTAELLAKLLPLARDRGARTLPELQALQIRRKNKKRKRPPAA